MTEAIETKQKKMRARECPHCHHVNRDAAMTDYYLGDCEVIFTYTCAKCEVQWDDMYELNYAGYGYGRLYDKYGEEIVD